jgi:hypothetical protein
VGGGGLPDAALGMLEVRLEEPGLAPQDTKFEQFDPGAVDMEVSIVMTTWDIERANAELTKLHRRMTNTKDSTYRAAVRIRCETGACGKEPSGAAVGWTNPPELLRGWPLEETPAGRRRPAFFAYMGYCRHLLAAAKTTRDWALLEREYAEKATAEERKRALAWTEELAKRQQTTRDAPGGYVAEHADEYCPTAMPLANQLDLSEHIWRLFADDAVVEGSSMRTQDFGPQGLQVSRSRGWLWERLNAEPCPSYITELWRLLGLAVTDQSTDNNPTADALHAIARRMLGVMNNTDQTSHMETPTSFLAIFEPLPGRCIGCSSGSPCCLVLVLQTARVTQAQIAGLDLGACGWTVEVLRNALRKRNLFRLSRTRASFDALVAAGVWPAGKAPSAIYALLPSFSALGRPELVRLFKAVLAGEAVCAGPDWDWEALGEDVETEAPAASEVADAAAFEARRNDGEDWEEEAFGSIDGH